MDDTPQAAFAVITGASSGIGFELAREFGEHGFDLLVTAETDQIDQAASRLRSLGAQVESVRADLATYDGVETLYERIRASGRPVDAIAINAGVGAGGPFVENDLDAELNLIALNVVSVVHLAKRVVRDMTSSRTPTSSSPRCSQERPRPTSSIAPGWRTPRSVQDARVIRRTSRGRDSRR